MFEKKIIEDFIIILSDIEKGMLRVIDKKIMTKELSYHESTLLFIIKKFEKKFPTDNKGYYNVVSQSINVAEKIKQILKLQENKIMVKAQVDAAAEAKALIETNAIEFIKKSLEEMLKKI